MKHREILLKAQTILNESDQLNALQGICELLQTHVKKYTWVGFYRMNHSDQTLHLGPFVGKPTDHTIIPFGRGICGQVAKSGETYIAEDVAAEGNYIACSMDVRSEIVVPIYSNGRLVAQLDIDSDEVNAFNEEDREFLEQLCREIGEKVKGLEFIDQS